MGHLFPISAKPILSSNMARAPRPTKDNLAKAREASFANAMARIAKIIAPGVVGFHTHFEIIEIIEFSNVARKATNVFTILVAEEHNEGVSETPGWLGDRIRLPQFKDSFFGVRRTVQPIAAILPRLNEIINGTWRFSSDTIAVSYTHLDVYKRQLRNRAKLLVMRLNQTSNDAARRQILRKALFGA